MKLSSLEDIVALEQQPYEGLLPFTTIDGLIDHLGSYGDCTAISFMPNGDVREPTIDISFRQLQSRIHQTANAFRSLGVDADTTVALLLPGLPETFIAMLAAELVGRACPINYMLSASAIVEILRAANTRVLVTFGPDAELSIWQKIDEIRRLVPGLEHVVCVGTDPDDASVLHFDTFAAAMPDEPLHKRIIGPDDIAAIYHTGGSTGTPKLVQHTHANQIHCLWLVSLFLEFGPSDTVINGHPLFHVAGALNFGIGPLAAGARLLIPSKFGLRNKMFQAGIWQIVEQQKATVTIGGPTFMTMLLGADKAQCDTSSLRLHMSGGAHLPPDLANAFEARFSVPVRNIWGMTETGGITALEPASTVSAPGTCGWRLPFTEIAAFRRSPDGAIDTRTPCATGEIGNLAIKGPHVTPGYIGIARDANSFISDGWFLTGDLGRIGADGRVELTGRAKDVIIRGGHNIDPIVIEDALLQHPDIKLCGAVGQPDSHSGEVPVAFITVAPRSHASAAELLAAIKPLIAEPAAVPKRLYILDSLPTTSTGKVLKPDLRRLATEIAVKEKLADLLGADTPLTMSFVNTGGKETVHIQLPAGTKADSLALASKAVATLRIAFQIS